VNVWSISLATESSSFPLDPASKSYRFPRGFVFQQEDGRAAGRQVVRKVIQQQFG
jgi:hypothetical protein